MGISSMELIVILVVLGLLVVAPLTIIAISKICCGVLSIWDDYKQNKRRRHNSTSTTSSTVQSKASSMFIEEKLALLEAHSRLARETGLRLDDYPFIVDYAPSPVGIPGLAGILGSNRRTRADSVSSSHADGTSPEDARSAAASDYSDVSDHSLVHSVTELSSPDTATSHRHVIVMSEAETSDDGIMMEEAVPLLGAYSRVAPQSSNHTVIEMEVLGNRLIEPVPYPPRLPHSDNNVLLVEPPLLSDQGRPQPDQHIQDFLAMHAETAYTPDPQSEAAYDSTAQMGPLLSPELVGFPTVIGDFSPAERGCDSPYARSVSVESVSDELLGALVVTSTFPAYSANIQFSNESDNSSSSPTDESSIDPPHSSESANGDTSSEGSPLPAESMSSGSTSESPSSNESASESSDTQSLSAGSSDDESAPAMPDESSNSQLLPADLLFHRLSAGVALSNTQSLSTESLKNESLLEEVLPVESPHNQPLSVNIAPLATETIDGASDAKALAVDGELMIKEVLSTDDEPLVEEVLLVDGEPHMEAVLSVDDEPLMEVLPVDGEPLVERVLPVDGEPLVERVLPVDGEPLVEVLPVDGEPLVEVLPVDGEPLVERVLPVDGEPLMEVLPADGEPLIEVLPVKCEPHVEEVLAADGEPLIEGVLRDENKPPRVVTPNESSNSQLIHELPAATDSPVRHAPSPDPAGQSLFVESLNDKSSVECVFSHSPLVKSLETPHSSILSTDEASSPEPAEPVLTATVVSFSDQSIPRGVIANEPSTVELANRQLSTEVSQPHTVESLHGTCAPTMSQPMAAELVIEQSLPVASADEPLDSQTLSGESLGDERVSPVVVQSLPAELVVVQSSPAESIDESSRSPTTESPYEKNLSSGLLMANDTSHHEAMPGKLLDDSSLVDSHPVDQVPPVKNSLVAESVFLSDQTSTGSVDGPTLSTESLDDQVRVPEALPGHPLTVVLDSPSLQSPALPGGPSSDESELQHPTPSPNLVDDSDTSLEHSPLSAANYESATLPVRSNYWNRVRFSHESNTGEAAEEFDENWAEHYVNALSADADFNISHSAVGMQRNEQPPSGELASSAGHRDHLLQVVVDSSDSNMVRADSPIPHSPEGSSDSDDQQGLSSNSDNTAYEE